MARETMINFALVQREIERFCSRIGMHDVPRIDTRHALVFNSQGGKLSLEINSEQTMLLISFAVKPDFTQTESMLKKALELCFYKGGYVLSTMYVDPYIIYMSKLNNSDISAESIESVLMQLVKVSEEVRNGY
ncbi:MAG: hypothetical protein K6F05_09330 [Succinivibrio sp.]|nr:hypothetical protein [Succinivibrio sp.]